MNFCSPIYDAAKPLCGFKLSINSYDCNKATLYKKTTMGCKEKLENIQVSVVLLSEA